MHCSITGGKSDICTVKPVLRGLKYDHCLQSVRHITIFTDTNLIQKFIGENNKHQLTY
jgi:hypothetical protein